MGEYYERERERKKSDCCCYLRLRTRTGSRAQGRLTVADARWTPSAARLHPPAAEKTMTTPCSLLVRDAGPFARLPVPRPSPLPNPTLCRPRLRPRAPITAGRRRKEERSCCRSAARCTLMRNSVGRGSRSAEMTRHARKSTRPDEYSDRDKLRPR